mmetsp:Transcript_125998/g.362360  ORF Transcript_125998/g.362360 Transcript_125998/m.362360 type:complete len:209 (-) Transcript_125998:91-717(-)
MVLLRGKFAQEDRSLNGEGQEHRLCGSHHRGDGQRHERPILGLEGCGTPRRVEIVVCAISRYPGVVAVASAAGEEPCVGDRKGEGHAESSGQDAPVSKATSTFSPQQDRHLHADTQVAANAHLRAQQSSRAPGLRPMTPDALLNLLAHVARKPRRLNVAQHSATFRLLFLEQEHDMVGGIEVRRTSLPSREVWRELLYLSVEGHGAFV